MTLNNRCANFYDSKHSDLFIRCCQLITGFCYLNERTEEVNEIGFYTEVSKEHIVKLCNLEFNNRNECQILIR